MVVQIPQNFGQQWAASIPALRGSVVGCSSYLSDIFIWTIILNLKPHHSPKCLCASKCWPMTQRKLGVFFSDLAGFHHTNHFHVCRFSTSRRTVTVPLISALINYSKKRVMICHCCWKKYKQILASSTIYEVQDHLYLYIYMHIYIYICIFMYIFIDLYVYIYIYIHDRITDHHVWYCHLSFLKT